MPQDDAGWETYEAVNAGHGLAGEIVSISRDGVIRISKTLQADWPSDMPCATIQRNTRTKQLRLVPCSITTPHANRYRQTKVSVYGALKLWGLEKDATQRCPARWIDGCLVIDYGKAESRKARRCNNDDQYKMGKCPDCKKRVRFRRGLDGWEPVVHDAPDGDPCHKGWTPGVE